MGKIENGILGQVTGRVGNVVGVNWRGINYLRVTPRGYTDRRSPSQLLQRAKFKLVQDFVRNLLPFIRIGFKNSGSRKSPYNAACSYNMKHAVAGSFPDINIDLKAAKVSCGTLAGVEYAVATSLQPHKVQVTWPEILPEEGAGAYDQAILVVYNPGMKDVRYSLQAGLRGNCSAEIKLPGNYSGCTVHVYIAFAKLSELLNDGPEDTISDSCFAGTITVL